MKSILVIDDNNDIRENTAEILDLAGYKTLTAENGKKGVDLALKEKPDLIVCDIMMPNWMVTACCIYSERTRTCNPHHLFFSRQKRKELIFGRGWKWVQTITLPSLSMTLNC